ncbi:MAG TPA: hypothetical protein VLA89_15840 [Gemmatimonadales bacterium]|nr:hypothetical protein [Gemmatimonadales bacterium]
MGNISRILPLVAAMLCGAIALVAALHLSSSSGGQEHPTTAQLITSLGPTLPAPQADLLADGVLTKDEYEGAIEREGSCMEADGLMVTRRPGEGVGGSTQLDVAADLRRMTLDEIRAAHTTCVDQYVGRLAIVWAEMHRPTSAELAADEDRFGACMADHGFADLVPLVPEILSNPGKGPYSPGTPEWNAIFACHDLVATQR